MEANGIERYISIYIYLVLVTFEHHIYNKTCFA